MDENAHLPSNSADSFNGCSDAAVAASTMKTYNFILAKYRNEFQAALNYDESKDRKHQKEMRKVARERQRQAEIDQIERDNAAKQNFEDFKERVKDKGIVTSFY